LTLNDQDARARALTALAPHLAADLLAQVLPPQVGPDVQHADTRSGSRRSRLGTRYLASNGAAVTAPLAASAGRSDWLVGAPDPSDRQVGGEVRLPRAHRACTATGQTICVTSRASVGGSAAAGGAAFQDEVFAWACAAMVAEQPLPPPLPPDPVVRVGAQTGYDIDDVAIETAASGPGAVQSKGGLTLGRMPASPLAEALDQVVAQYLKACMAVLSHLAVTRWLSPRTPAPLGRGAPARRRRSRSWAGWSPPTSARNLRRPRCELLRPGGRRRALHVGLSRPAASSPRESTARRPRHRTTRAVCRLCRLVS
jgi:hypothetical protein